MKFAICNDTYADRDCLKAAEHAAQCGYQGIELAPSTVWNNPLGVSPKEAHQLSQDIESRGLEVLGFHWLLTGTKGYAPNPSRKSLSR